MAHISTAFSKFPVDWNKPLYVPVLNLDPVSVMASDAEHPIAPLSFDKKMMGFWNLRLVEDHIQDNLHCILYLRIPGMPMLGSGFNSNVSHHALVDAHHPQDLLATVVRHSGEALLESMPDTVHIKGLTKALQEAVELIRQLKLNFENMAFAVNNLEWWTSNHGQDIGPNEQWGSPPKSFFDTFPALSSEKRSCPVCWNSSETTLKLGTLIVHLNDKHRWTREAIADWLRLQAAEGKMDITAKVRLDEDS